MQVTRIQIAVFLAVAAIAWGGVLFSQNVPISLRHVAPFGTVVAILAACAFVLEKWLWSWRWLHPWMVSRPDLRGTWKVLLESDWVDPKTNGRIGSIVGYAGIEQTLSTIQIHVMTSESESWLVAHNIRSSPSERGFQIVGVYTNKPHMHLRLGKSAMHLGALVIDTHGQNPWKPDSMTAEYWTDRKTTGRIIFSARVSTVFTRYEDAVGAFAR